MAVNSESLRISTVVFALPCKQPVANVLCSMIGDDFRRQSTRDFVLPAPNLSAGATTEQWSHEAGRTCNTTPLVLVMMICKAMQISFGFRQNHGGLILWVSSLNHLKFVAYVFCTRTRRPMFKHVSVKMSPATAVASLSVMEGAIGSSKYLICNQSRQSRHKRLGVRGDHFQSLRICIILTPPQCLSGTKEKKNCKQRCLTVSSMSETE